MKKMEASFIVNGVTYDTYVDPHALLVEVLRDEIGYGSRGFMKAVVPETAGPARFFSTASPFSPA
jgi:hypothetical protein